MTRLRPLTLADVEVLEPFSRDAEARGEFQWFGFPTVRRMRAAVLEERTVSPQGGRFAIVDGDDAVIGDVSWHLKTWGPAESACWDLGVFVVPAARRRGHGTAAQRLVAAYLFAHTRVERVQAFTDIGNVGEQGALAAAGFSREGVLRRAQWRNGAWHDQVLFSVLRGEL